MQADVAARALRDAGFEVIYAPPGAGPDQLAEAALQEDADAVAVPTGADGDRADVLCAELRARGIEDVLVVSTGGEPAEVASRLERGLGLDGDS
jgi:methylmalonyl-CoA mutase C-terminal domain/subunit